MAPSDRDYAVGILNYGTKELLLENVDRCLRSGLAPERLIVWDNASTDGSSTAVAERFPAIRCVASKVNLGYAGGMNAIVESAGAERVVLVTADCFVTLDVIQALVATLESDPAIALVGCRIVDRRTGRIQSEGGDITYPLGVPLARAWQRELADAGPGAPVDVGYLDGALLAVDRRKFTDLGGFDPAYFAYQEDVDLSWRARMFGYRVVCASSFSALHATSASLRGHASLRWTLTERNRVTSNLKNLEFPHLGMSLLYEGLYAVAVLVGASWLGLSEYRRSYAGALLKAAASLPPILERRRAVQRVRRVPDRIVLASHPKAGLRLLAKALSDRAVLAREFRA